MAENIRFGTSIIRNVDLMKMNLRNNGYAWVPTRGSFCGADRKVRKKVTVYKNYVVDPHGNVVQLTDENGKVTKTYEYDSFGNEVKPDEKDDNPFRYCGEYLDKETGEVYLRARYYQPEKGRFLTRDTYTGEEDEPESLHLYAYCGNDGVNQVDPSGHDSYIIYDKNSEAGTPGYMFYNEALNTDT